MDPTAYPGSNHAGNVDCFNVTNNHNNINNIVNVNKVIPDENPEIMRWLSPLDPRIRHQDVCTNRLDCVGNWILETTEFREWRSSDGGADKAVLYCYGNPGVGKTYLSSLVVDSLYDGPGEEDIAIAMFYCDFRRDQEQTTTNIIGAILKQLMARLEVRGPVQAAFQKARRELGSRGLRLSDMVQLLKSAIAMLPQVFVCIDAVDECPPKNLLELLRSLKDILQESPRTRIFVTGRPHVEAEITRYFTTAVIIPINSKAHDIKIYLEKRLEMDPEPDAMSDGLRADILRIIPERISEIFLLVSLSIDAVLGEVTIRLRRRKLDQMTKGNHLGDAYATTLARIKDQRGDRSRLGMEALMWVSNSERPLLTRELCHALGVKIGSTDLDVENVPTIRTILASSLGLITVKPSSGTVHLVHFTLQEFLSGNPRLFRSPHSMIADVCLTYLSFKCVRELSPTLRSAPSTLALIEYATYYWGKHIRREETGSARPLALRLLIGFEQHISSRLLLLHYFKDRWSETRFANGCGPEGFTGLHGAAFLGIVEIVAALLAKKEWDINATDAVGRTALAWAAVGGHEAVAKLLLEQRNVNPNAADTEYGGTPLLWAAKGGREGVVGLLLEREDVNSNTTDAKYGGSPLWWAAKEGREGVVRLLLKREDVNPNAADTKCGGTPLLWAAKEGYEGVVRLLLERRDINLNTTDTEYGQTPLLWAAREGRERVVRLLLERKDINPDTTDTKYGGTPLMWAAKEGREGVVRLLLKRGDADPNTADTKCGGAPLLWAAKEGCEGVVRLLLEREDTNPNTTDTEYGQTPLLWAAREGHEGVVRLLLKRKDIKPDTTDTKYGGTPLMWAAKDGYEGVVGLLLEREGVNPDAIDAEYGGTPLWWAAKDGREGVVKLLLKQGGMNPNITDTKYGGTPLWCAAKEGRDGVVKLLLERDDVDPDVPSRDGKTAIELATSRGHARVVELLSKPKPSLFC